MNVRDFVTLVCCWVVLAGGVGAAGPAFGADIPNPFDAEPTDARPRIFFRDDAGFDGLTLVKLRERMGLPEFAAAREKWRSNPMGRTLLWMLDKEDEDLRAAVESLMAMGGADDDSWSDRGETLVQMAAMFDWLYPALDDPTRRQVIAMIERHADDAVEAVEGGHAPFFYTRTPGALAGLAAAGLALHGVSDKSRAYLDTFRRFGVEEYFKACQWVDGAATGASYTLTYTYVHLPSICAAWWSATEHNPAPWIHERQGDWLGGIVRFYLWSMRPGFAFTDVDDLYRDLWSSGDQFCQGLDIATYLTRDGFGRTWAQRWHSRFGRALYHAEHSHNLIFRDPSVHPRRLSDLPDGELFGRDSCGYGFFRSGWPAEGEPDSATHVFFRMGDPMDVHGGVAAGEFQVFKFAPLASRSGRYERYDSAPDQYHRNCISANVVLFTDPAIVNDRGDQNSRAGLKTDHATWDEWLGIRRRNALDVATITDWKVADGEARCRADLTRTNGITKCKRWEREFVWLANKHLVVLDIIEKGNPHVRPHWQLHLPGRPDVGDRLLTVSNRPPDAKHQWEDERLRPADPNARLFCRTLLPREYSLVVHGGGQAEAFDPTGRSTGAAPGNPYHLEFGGDVIQIDPVNAGPRVVFLHVLTAAGGGEMDKPPAASHRLVRPGLMEITVDESKATVGVPEWFTE